MSKKTIVTSVLVPNVPEFAASYFRIGDLPLNSKGFTCMMPGEVPEGEEPVPAFPPVVEIKSCRDRFGSGAQIDQPCYMVSFQDAPEKVVIPANKYCQATIAVIDTEDAPIPAMPE